MTLVKEKPSETPQRTRRPGYGAAGVVFRFVKRLINLEEDKADEEKTIEEIKKGVPFRGANLWILIFAIFIASIGLNVNSTAVIIGAMLISPLMGPIMGIGLGMGINDLELIKKGVMNLAVAVVISVLTSTIYFMISPLSDAQSELLARTTPTLWDVMIAVFGGLAGIVAGSRREKSNAIPGVAIATALMPPLCTAGYGLATGNLYYFFGAFYLFFINTVFISLSTFLIVRYLKYPKKVFVDEARERRVKSIISFFVLLTILPSFFTAYQVVRRSIFERNAQLFVSNELAFDNSPVISREFTFSDDTSRIEITLFGAPVSKEIINHASQKLGTYSLEGTTLVVHQGYEDEEDNLSQDVLEKYNQSVKAGIIEELYRKNEQALNDKNDKIAFLEKEITLLKGRQVAFDDICREVKVQYPGLKEFSLSVAPIATIDSLNVSQVTFAYANFATRQRRTVLQKMEEWLKVRTQSDSLRLIVQ
ncbi:TIGR00341 family protein [Roseivirga sp. BDSF3-8]|uniref:TIGR00341 family protein n=1 Tax=Roseivirga sp. BDSF3-8 TaxID=3241598 RepID=UPI003531A433